jgi:RNA recognition motif-containing protein
MTTSKLFVSNLAATVTEETLRELFGEKGRPVGEVTVITERATGISRGFGFVQLNTTADAIDAVSSLDGREVDGRIMAVREAHKRTAETPTASSLR